MSPSGRCRQTVTCSDGATLACQVVGDGPPIVLLHGLACTDKVWEPVIPALVDAGHQVITVELRGHGDSSPLERPITIDQLGDDVRSVLATLDLRDVTLVGHSAGGYHILAYARRNPGDLAARVRAVVTFGTYGSALALRERATLAFAASRPFYALLRHPVGRVIIRRGAFGRTPNKALVEQTRVDALRCPRLTKRLHVNATAGTTLMSAAANISVPFTVVTGSGDVVVRPRRARELAAMAPCGRAVIIPGAGHMAPIESPEAVSRIVLSAASRPTS